ncbi:hypothetical protein FNV43_RR00653 [Rhamnella rubrinervis]|uniref:Uncharacterized protein n=1 Tax=Rhamnella rubrinervis TaxID=2594499 RepID=A0A8K0HP22_9ROSA|nr:hypothetical protein FNV43_RR00653 [Rhamnella rubrinervis]
MPIYPNSRFNSHLIIEDITEAEGNFDVYDFLVDYDPTTQNFDYELALTNDSEKLSNNMYLPILKASSTKAHILKS